jgi:hypothetical protein
MIQSSSDVGRIFVVADFFFSLGVVGAIDDPLAVGRVVRAAVVAEFVRELLDVGAVGVHGIDIEVAMAQGREDDLFSVNRNGCFGVVARRVG